MNNVFNKQNSEKLRPTSTNGNLTPLIILRSRCHHQITSPYGLSARVGVGRCRESLLPLHLRSTCLPYGFSTATHSENGHSVVSPASLSVVQKLEVVDDDVLVMDDVQLTSDAERKVPVPKIDSISGGAGGGFIPSSIRNLGKDKEICKSLYDFRPSQETVHPQQLAPGQGQMQINYSSMVGNKPEARLSNAYTCMKPYTYSLSLPAAYQPMPGTASILTHQDIVHPLKFTAFPVTGNKPEAQPYELYNRTRSFTYSLNSPISEATSVSTSGTPTSTTKPNNTGKTVTPITKLGATTRKTIAAPPTSTLKADSDNKTNTTLNQDWSPLDDGIMISFPIPSENPPVREDIDALIQNVLYGPAKTTRLPFFSDFCLEDKLPPSGKP